jgi:hypothetical protein
VIQNGMVELSHLLSVYYIQQGSTSCPLDRNRRRGITYHRSQSHFSWQIDRTGEAAAHGHEMEILLSNSNCESPNERCPPYDMPRFWWSHFESRNFIDETERWQSWLECWRNYSIIVTALFLKAKNRSKLIETSMRVHKNRIGLMWNMSGSSDSSNDLWIIRGFDC